MTEAERRIWEFAVANPDHWPLLQTQEDAPEVSALSPEDQEAFEAARVVVQERAVKLMRKCWDELGERAGGTQLGEWMPNRPQRATILGGKMRALLPNNKGQLYVVLWASRGTLSMWATLRCAKKRLDDAGVAWGDGDSVYTDGNSFSVFHHIAPDLSDDENAKAFTDDYWPRLARWMGYIVAPDPDDSGDEDGDGE